MDAKVNQTEALSTGRNCSRLLALGALVACSSAYQGASAAVNQIDSPTALVGGVTISFDDAPSGTVANTRYLSQGITFGRDDGRDVFLYNYQGYPPPFSSPNSLATVGNPWATHLNVSSTQGLYGIGAYVGNDVGENPFVRLSAYDASHALLGRAAIRTNGNAAVDQFLGLKTNRPISYARFDNLHFDGSQSTYYSVIIDDLVYTRSPQPIATPRTFGLFVGVKDGSGTPALRGDTMALQLKSAFANDPMHVAFSLTADATIGGVISKDQITKTLLDMRSQMNAGDSLVLYLNGHGTSQISPYKGEGNDGINLGATLYDKDLYTALETFDPLGVVRKQTFIDACHSGGFWGPGDPAEIGVGDLDKLQNIALFASAAENKLMYYDNSGRGFFSQALLEATTLGLEQYSAASLQSFLYSESRRLAGLWQKDNPVFFEGQLGDAVPSDPTLLGSYFAASSDFNLGDQLTPVPEPGTNALMALGLGAVAVGIRRGRRTAC